MSDIERALHDLAERGHARGAGTVFERASHGPATRDRRPAGTLVALAAAVVLAAVVAVALRADDPQDVVIEPPPAEGVFSTDTGTVLLFDDGYSGVAGVDLDTGQTFRRELEGQRAGDQPFRLHRVGGRLVVGWGDVHSVPVDGGAGLPLGDATVFLPAAEDGSVWLVDYPGGRIGDGEPTLRRVAAADGTVLEDLGAQPAGTLPARGVAGGMAYETARGVEVRDRDGATVAQLDGVIGDVQGSLVAWCGRRDAGCTELHVLDLATDAAVTAVPRDPAFAVNPAAIRFSPDGTLVAAQTGPEILVVDTDTGDVVHAIDGTLPDAGYLGWSEDGSQLFFTSYSYGAQETVVGRIDVATGATERRVLDHGGFLSFVAVPRERATVVDDLRNRDLALVPMADEVRLLLGRETVVTRRGDDLVDPRTWSLDVSLFAGYTGPFSALRTLVGAPAVTNTEGPVDHCAGPPLPDPTDFTYDEHLVAEPVLAPDASCLDWFAVEVFLRDGDIVAVGLDRFEP